MDDICANRHGGADTSVAAHSSTPESSRVLLRKRIVDFIASQKERGATCEETEAALGLTHQTCSARISELRQANKIRSSGARRLTHSGRLARVHIAVTE
jgi:hypothetical protein